MTEKPLHVKVAEALGWTRAHYPGDHGFGVPGHPCGDILLPDVERLRWKGRAPEEMVVGADCTLVPRYDTDWSATGPLIERFKTDLGYEAASSTPPRYSEATGEMIWPGDKTPDSWMATAGTDGEIGTGPTPLVAVCEWILLMHELGTLPR